VEITPAAEKQLRKLPQQEVQKMRNQLDQLAQKENPVKYLTPLKGDWSPFYRLRVGDYRLIIDIEGETLTLLLVRAGHRKDVYN
jgi:mRNA interferase RelE/StbE